MITVESIRQAAEDIFGRVHRTPLLTSRTLSERCGCHVKLKAENLQKTGSFKARGVFNRIRHLSDQERERGLIGVSAGNHAQALAYGSAVEGVNCTVVMPSHASQTKVDASRAYGAEVVLHGDVFGAFAKMEELRAERGLTLVHPYEDEHVMAGQGTVGLEILEDLPLPNVVIVPIGGGGLISGIATAIKGLSPMTRVIGVEPVGAPALTRGLEAGAPVRLENIDTIADGLAAPIAGAMTLAHVRAFVDDVVLVSDDDIREAVRHVLERSKLLLEPAGAAAVAALMSGKVAVDLNDEVVCVISGGNFDLKRLKDML